MSQLIYKRMWVIMTMFFFVSIFSCEEPYTPSTIESQQEYVIEGYVEVGKGASPVIVIVSKSIPYLSEVSPTKFAELFVKGADVSVFDGDKTTVLTPLCLQDLPEEVKKMVAEALNLPIENLTADICVYVDIFQQINKEFGREYELKVVVEDKTLTATTSVPLLVTLNEYKWEDPPGEPNDTLARLLATIDDPGNVKNYYRYFTALDDEPLTPPFGSVTDDAFFNGMRFEFPLQKAERRGGDFSPETFGLYKRGSQAIIKWCSIDKAHFDFWNTRDFNANSGGPFSTYTRITTNINGGLGIWGGYAMSLDTLQVPPK
ncbi:MAG: DUF4249 domain-containing protein [Saprospiraceae bacterium]